MRYIVAVAGMAMTLLATSGALAGEQTVTLNVDNLFCASCPYIVKQTLAGIPGVNEVEVSYKEKTAVVTFDDNQTDVAALTAATTDAGFPSRPAGSPVQ
jgi:mercuric ion binding protein